ncbi:MULTISPECIES: hypothetical protein [Roseobacteraceae]|uniref:hypothetical protein n=1 Tax=Roseobacteraceae TaxID=2854170 RepID=UPI00186830A1|nr:MULTISPECIES: hypothetical protein [Roseobacteraceae]MCI5099926.1 hypothetical protein [Phaeobacter italicus]
MAPQMMGCCSFGFFGLFAGLISMATPLIAVAAIVYLLAKRPQAAVRPNEA